MKLAIVCSLIAVALACSRHASVTPQHVDLSPLLAVRLDLSSGVRSSFDAKRQFDNDRSSYSQRYPLVCPATDSDSRVNSCASSVAATIPRDRAAFKHLSLDRSRFP